MQVVTLWSRRKLGGALAGAVFLGPVAAAGGRGPVTHEVAIRSFRFEPESLTIRPGDSVRWTNGDIAPHTATETDGDWDTGELGRGESAEVVLEEPGKIGYFCAFHPHMTGEITVARTG